MHDSSINKIQFMYVVAQGFCFCSAVHSFGSPNKITITGPDGPTYIFGWFLPRVPKYRCTWPPYLATGKTVSSCMRFDSALSFKESTGIAPLALFNFSCFFIRHGYLNCNFENYQTILKIWNKTGDYKIYYLNETLWKIRVFILL